MMRRDRRRAAAGPTAWVAAGASAGAAAKDPGDCSMPCSPAVPTKHLEEGLNSTFSELNHTDTMSYPAPPHYL